MANARPICLRLLRQAIRLPFSFALEIAGSNREARMAMMAITISNSIRVNAAVVARWGSLRVEQRAEFGHAKPGNFSLAKLVTTFLAMRRLIDLNNRSR